MTCDGYNKLKSKWGTVKIDLDTSLVSINIELRDLNVAEWAIKWAVTVAALCPAFTLVPPPTNVAL